MSGEAEVHAPLQSLYADSASRLPDSSASNAHPTSTNEYLRSELMRQAKELATLTSLIEAERQERNNTSSRIGPGLSRKAHVLKLFENIFVALRARMEPIYGTAETFRLLKDVVIDTDMVNVVWYLDANPDVRDAGVDPVTHFIEYGLAEERSPNAVIDRL